MTTEKVIYCIENFAMYHAKGDLPYSAMTLRALEKAVEVLKKELPRDDADKLDCYNCKWMDYAPNNKCVPCRLNKCNGIEKNMYEEWDVDYE